MEDLVGLVPAAGTSTRLGRLPCSKEILPVAFRTSGGADERIRRPRVAAEWLLDAMREAGADRAVMVLRTGKWDVPSFFEGGDGIGLRLAYLVTPGTVGVPYTLAEAAPFLEDARVLFGFPDILFEPRTALRSLAERQWETGAELVLGLFPAARPRKMDMVRLDSDGRIRSIVIKPETTNLRYTWILAAWSSAFTQFLSGWCAEGRGAVAERKDSGAGAGKSEPYMGDVIQAALDEGMDVESVVFEEGSYVDVGTPGELASTVERLARGRSKGDWEGLKA